MADKKIYFLSSIQAKVIFITILIITLMLGFYAYYDYKRNTELLKDELSGVADITVQRLANNLRIPLWDLDKDLVIDTINAEMLSRDVSSIIVFDTDGTTVFAAKTRNKNWDVITADEALPLRSSEIRKRSVIKNDEDEKVGSVMVDIHKEFKEEELKRSAIGAIFTLLVLDLTIVLVLWIVMRNALIKPITRLSDAAEQISHGQFDGEIEAARRNDEIGLVAHSIERMQTSLNISMDQIKSLTQKHKAVLDMAAKREALKGHSGGANE